MVDNLTEIGLRDPLKVLSDICQKNSNRLVVVQLKINSLRHKFAPLSTMIKDNINILLISKTTIDSSLFTVQFQINNS